MIGVGIDHCYRLVKLQTVEEEIDSPTELVNLF